MARAQNPTTRAFGHLAQASKVDKRGPAPFPRPRTQRPTFSTACRGLGNPPNAALHCFRGPEANGARLRPLAAGFETRKRRPCTVFRAQNTSARGFGRLAQASKSGKRGPAPFSGLRTQRRVLLAIWRRLRKSTNAALHRFRGPEPNGPRFRPLAAGLEIRQTRPCTVFGAQKPTAHVFGRLPQASKPAKGGPAPFSGLRIRRRAALAAWRRLRNPANAALHRFRGSEPNDACFWPFGAGFESRQTRPCTVSAAQNPTAHVFDRLPRAWKSAKRGPALFSGPRSQRRTSSAACRRLRNPQKAALHRFQGSEYVGARLWPLGAGFEIRQTRPCTVFGAQNPTTRAFGHLAQASKVDKRGPAPFPRPRTQRPTFSTACRGLGNPPNAALHCFRGPEANGARLRPLAAGFETRKRRPCTVFRAQNTSARGFGRLAQASKSGKRGPAPFSGLRTQRRVLLAIWRRLRKSTNAALHRFRGPEPNGPRFRPLAAGLEIRQTRPCTVFGAQKPTAHVFGRLPQASKPAKGGPAPFSGLRIRRRAALAAWRRLRNPANAALHRFRGSEPNDACFWPFGAGFESRQTRPCTVSAAQNPTAHVFDRLPRAWKSAKRGPALFSGPRSQRRTSSAACRRLRNPQKAALHRFQGSEYVGARLWPLGAGFEIRQTRPCTVFGAQNPTTRAFGHLAQASKVDKRGPAPFPRPRTQRPTFSTACRGLGNPPNAALHCFRGPEANGARLRPLAAGFETRKRRPCTVFRAQNTSARGFGRLAQASKSGKRGPAPFSGLRTQRRVLLAIWRRLRKSTNAALHRFRGPEPNGPRFRPLAAGLEIRQTRPCTVFGAQKPTAHVFGRLPQASKPAKGGPAPFSGLRIRRRAALAAWRRLRNPANAALHRFRGSEPNDACFWPFGAGFESRQTRPCTVSAAQNPTAHVFDRLPRAWKSAKRGPALFSGPRSQRRTSSAACRRLRNPQKAALHRFQGSEYVGARLWPLGAGFEIRQTRPCTVFGAQNPTTRAFGHLAQASKVDKRGPAPFPRPRTQRPTFSTACRGLGNPPNAALHCFRGPEANGARLRPLAAGFETRKRRPCTVFRAQNTSARGFGRLAQASKSGKRGPAPFSGLRTQRRVLLAIWRRLRKSTNAALHRFRGPEPNGPRFRPLAAGLEIRQTRPCTVFGAQKPTAHVFGRLPQASKPAKGGPAPFSGLRIRRRAALAAWRRLRNPANAALHRFRGSEPNDACFWPFGAGFESRQTRPCTVSAAQNPTAHVFDRLPRAWKSAKRGPALFSGPRSQRRTSSAACRRLRNPQKAALHRFQGSEYVGARLWPLGAGFEIRQTRPCTVFGAQNPTTRAFGHLAQASKVDKRGPAPFPRPRTQRPTFSTACRGLGNPPNAALHCFRGPEANGARLRPLAAGFETRKRRPCTVFRAQNTSARGFGRLAQASKSGKRGPAPFSGLRTQRRVLLAIWRRLRKSTNAALHRFRGPEPNGPRFRPLAAGLEIRQTRPCTVFGAQKPTAHVFGRLPQASKPAKGGPAPFSGLRIRRRAALAAWRRLRNPANAALHRFRGSEPNDACFWPFGAGFESRQTRPCTVSAAQNPTAHVFDRLPRAWKSAKRGPALFSGPRSQRRTSSAACRRLRNPQKAALHRFQGSEYVGARLWPLGAGFEIRQTRPCTVFGAQNPTTRAFGHLAQASKVDKRGPAPFPRPRTQRPTFSTACRGLGNPPNAALHCFRGPEANGARLRPLAAGFETRKRRPCTVFRAQNTSARGFGRLAQASKSGKRGPAPFSGLRTQRRVLLAIWRRLRKSTNAALHRFRGPEPNGPRFRPLAAGLEIRQTRPCTVFGAQKPTAHVFGRLPQASKPAKGGPAPFSGLRIRRRAALAAWRRLRNPANAALHRFRGSEPNDACFWPFGAGFESRQTRPCTVSAAQNPTAHVFDRLPRAWKSAKRGPALFSGPRSQRRTSSAACRRLRNPQKAALHRFQGSEYVGARLWPLGAGFEIRQTRPCTVFGAQNPTTRAFGHLAQASKVDKRGPAPFPRPRTQRPTFSTACRGLGNPPNAALHCFRGPEANGARLRPLAAGFETRKRRPCTVFRAQNTSARGFGRLAQASKSGKRGPAPFSGLRTQRRVLLAIWRRLRKSTNAALHRFRGPEPNGPRFRPLAAGLEIRQTRPCTVFGAQKPTAHVFGRLPQASKPAKGGPAPFSGLRIRRRAALAAWRRLRNPANAALHRFRGSEPNDACFWPFGAGFESRQTRPCTVSAAQNPTAHVFDRLPRAWKSAKRGPALFSGPRSQRRTSSAACRRLRNPQKAALHRFQGSEYVGARLWPLGAGFEIRQTRPCTVFGAQNPTTRAFGHLAQASKVDKRGPAPFPRPRTQRPTFSTACRGLGNPPNAALHCFRGPEANGARLRPLAAGFETRKRRPCTVFRAQNTSARGFGRLAQASKSGKRGPAPFSGLRTQRRVLLAIWRRLRKSTNAALHRFRGPEPNGPRFRPLAAGLEIRQTRPCTVFGAQKPTAHVFGRLPQASKPAKGGPAPFSGLRIRRRAALAAWRRLRNPANAALHRFRGSEPNDACFWPFGAGFESRQTRPCTVSAAQNPTAHVFDRLPRAWKSAKRGPALFSGPRSQRRTSSAACRRLRNPQKAALHRFQGSEYVGARLWPLGAGFEIRQTRPCTVFGAQNPTTRAFGHLAQASKVDKRGPAPFPRPRTQRPTFSTACRGLGNPPNAALHCFRGPEANGARLRPLAAGFETRKRRPCTVFRAQNTSARGFGRLAQASKSGKRGPAPFSGLRTQRRVLLAIWRRLRKSTNAALHRFRGPEPNGPRFRPLAAGLEIRQTRPCTVFGAQKPTAHVFGRLPQASKPAKGGPAPFSGLRIRRRAALAAWRRLRNPANAALHRFRGSEPNDACFWPFGAGFESRQTRPCTVSAAQNPTAHVFDRLPRAWKSAKRGPALFSGPRSQRRTSSAACRRLRNPQKAALHRFQGSEYVGARLWPLGAGFEIRQTRPCTVFGAQNPTTRAFGHLAQASKVDKRGPAPFPRPRTQRPTFSTACRGLGNPPNAALHCFRGPEANGARLRPLAAGFETRKRRPCTVFRAQNTSARGFGRLAQASKSGKRGPAPFSGLRTQRRVLLAIWRRLRKSTNAALHRFRGPEPNGPRFRPLAAGLEIRQTRPCTVFGAQKPTAHVFGRLPQASKPAKGGPAPFSGLRIRRRAALAAWRRLRNPANAALHRFRGSEPNDACFWPFGAGFESRQTRPCTVSAAQNPTAHVFDRLPRAWKSAKRGPALFSGPRSQRRTSSAACRRLRNPQKAALHRFQGSEYVGARLWPLGAGFEIRQTRPCTVFGAQNPTTRAFGHLAQASKVDKRGPAPFPRPRTQRPTFSTACRGLGNPPNAALHCFRGPEANGARLRPLAAGFETRKRRPCTVFRAQNTSARGFGRLAQASKSGKRGPAPFSGLRTQRRVLLAIWRRLRKSTNAALHRFRGPEPNGPRFRPLAAGLEIRQTRPCTVFGAQKPTAHVFGRLPQASKPAKGGPAPFSGLRIRRRAALAAWRRLRNPANAALHRFRGSEPNDACFWPFGAGFESRQTRPCTVSAAQNPTAHVFDRLPRAWKSAKRGPALFSGPRSQRRTSSAACRRLRNPQKAALHRFQGSEYVGARLWPLGAGFEIRQTRPCTVFGAQNPTTRAFGHLAQASKVDKRGPAPFPRPRTQRPTFSTACRGLGNPPNAALHCFRGPEANGARLRPLAAGFETRKRRPCTVFRAQNTSARGFGRLAQASKSGKRGPAPFSGLRTQRRVLLAIWRRLRKSTNAALHRFRGPEPNGPRFRPLAAGLEIRQTRPCTVFGAQKPTAHVFGRLPQASKPAKGGPAPFSGLRIRRRAALAAWRRLRNPANAALHRFRGSEPNDACFWPFGAGFESRQTRPCTVSAAQNPTAHVFDRLPRAWKSAKRGPALFSGPRSQRRTSSAACRRLRNPQKAALHRFQGSEYVGARLWPLGAGFEIRQTRPCTVFGAQNPTTRAFGHLAQASKVDKRGPAPFPRPRTQRPTFSTACRGLGNPPNAALHCFRGPEANGARLRPLAAGFETRKRRPCTVFRAQNTSARGFGRLAQASKSGKRGPAPFSGLRTQRRVLLAIWRRLRKSTNAALHRFRGPEPNGPRFRPLAAGLEIRQTRPCTVFGAQKPTAHVFGRLPQASKPAKGGPAPFSGLRIRRRAALAAWRRLRNPANAALHRFRGSEPNDACFWPFGAGFESRQTRPCTVSAAQNPTAHVFDRLPRAWKSAKRGPALFSGPRSQRRTSSAACRRLRNPQKAALHRFQGSEYVGARLWPLGAGFEIRQTRPCTVFGAQNPTTRAFGHLAQASKVDKRGPAPFPRPRTQRPTFSTACRGLGNPPNAALHCFRGPEANGARLRPLAAGFETRKRRPCTVFRAQNTSARGFGRLAQASKSGKRGPAPFSGLRTQRRVLLAIWRRLRKSTNAALHRFRGPEPNGPRFRPLAAGLEIRQTRPCTVFGAQKPTAHVFGRLPQASKPAKGGPAPFSGLRIRRRAALAAWRRLRNPANAALHRFRGSEPNDACFWPFGAGFESRQTRPCTVSARTQRPTFSTACRGLGNPPNAALHCFRGPEANGARLRPLAAGFETRKRRPCTVFRAQNTSARGFGRLAQASKSGKRGPAPFSGLRTQRRVLLAIWRRLRKSTNAALHRFRGPEPNGPRFRPLAAGLEIRQTRPCTVFGAQKPTAHVFGRLPQASKPAKGGPAPFSGLRIRRRAALAAWRRLRNPANAALHRFRGSEPNDACFWPFGAGFESRQTRPCTVSAAQNPFRPLCERQFEDTLNFGYATSSCGVG